VKRYALRYVVVGVICSPAAVVVGAAMLSWWLLFGLWKED
jgi:hypothetical protein